MLKSGKLENDVLKKIVLDSIKYKSQDVITRAAVGEDCATIDFGEYNCVMSTDPITAAVSEIGKIAIHITCNDIASNGVKPLGIMLALMMPEGTTEEDIQSIMKQAGKTAEQMQVEIIGGHTEITAAVTKPVIVSTAIGKCEKQEKRRNPKDGDRLLLTKYAGMEGSGILASDFEELLKDILDENELEEAKILLENISVVKEGIISYKSGSLEMHDVTEGGILGAVWELCHKNGLGCEIYKNDIPVKKVTKKVCDFFEVDYLKIISSGCMLIICGAEEQKQITDSLNSEGIICSIIGELTDISKGMKLYNDKVNKKLLTEISQPESDDLYKAFENSKKK